MIDAGFKDRFGNAVRIVIEGTTPAIREGQPDPFLISGCEIAYNDDSLRPGVNDWKGSVAFVGSFNDYRAFGAIGYRSHRVTVTCAGLTFRGFLLPEVYDMAYTGHSVLFTLNFESILGQLEREAFDEATGLYSIEAVVNKIASITGCTVDYRLSFAEPFSSLMVYSANFVNDDKNKENYMRILEWIACTFGLRVTLFGTMLTLYSCERMQDAAGGAYPEVHYGADETVSVNRECDTCAVHVNNYALPGIPVDFDLSTGTLKLDVQPLPMRIRQGRAFYGYQTGNWHTYIRQLYEFQEGQKDWNLNKYSSAGVKVDEFDESQYIVGGVPLAGAYPVAVLRDGEGTYRSYIWLKGHNNGASITDPLLSCYLPNFITTPNTFFVFSLQGMMAMHYGNVNGWEYPGNAGFTRRFNADDNATYSANYDECAVPIDPYSSISSDVATDTGLAMRIKYKKQDGTVLYWYGETYEWLSTEFPNYLSLVDAGGSGEALSEFRFGALGFKTFFHWESPHYKDGTKAVFYNEEIPDYSVWFYLPSTIGDLTIEFSIPANGNRPWQMYNFLLLSDSMTFRMLEAIESLEEVDLSACDVIYSNSESETVDAEETFYIYSENDYGGRGMLYRDTSDSPVDTLTYPYGSEKPEWNYIALMTQLYSRCQVNRDIISINDFRLLYADRFVNSASIDVLTGLVRVSTVKPDSYTLTPVS